MKRSCLHPKILRICFSSSCSSHLLGARTAVENKIKFGVGLNSSFHNNNYQTVWLIFKKERWIEGEFEVWSFGVWSLNWTFVGCGRVQKYFQKYFQKLFHNWKFVKINGAAWAIYWKQFWFALKAESGSYRRFLNK